jgi:uncharacterized membrane protein YfcA
MTFDALDLGLLLLTGLGAGVVGAGVGIGGGVLVIPVLVLGFGIDVRVAVTASLAAVIATSVAAGSVYVGEGLTNMRLAVTLEVATTSGALAGGITAALIPQRALLLVFAVFLVVTATLLFVGAAPDERHRRGAGKQEAVGYEAHGRLAGAFRSPRTGEVVEYRARRLPLGLAVSFLAGNVSGLLGVGGGFLKVPAMRVGMKVPMRVAAATSNFMIGVTAAASLVIYVQRGFLFPLVAAPIAIGVAVGALAGTRLSVLVSGRALARLLAVLLVVVALQMSLKAAGVSLG